MTKTTLAFVLLLHAGFASAQKVNQFDILSPDGKLKLTVETGSKIIWSLSHRNSEIITSSAISMTLGNGFVLGRLVKIISSQKT